MAQPSAAKRSPSRTNLVLFAAAALLAVAVIWWLHARAANAAPSLVSSGTPGPDLSGGQAQQPNGGASSIPDQLPQTLLSSPDTLQQQVQQTDAGQSIGPDTSSSTAAAVATTTAAPAVATTTAAPGYSYVNPEPGQTAPAQFISGNSVYTQSSPGSDYYTIAAAPSSHPGTPGAAPVVSLDSSTGGPRRPGVQL